MTDAQKLAEIYAVYAKIEAAPTYSEGETFFNELCETIERCRADSGPAADKRSL